jgi:hypothetical protein
MMQGPSAKPHPLARASDPARENFFHFPCTVCVALAIFSLDERRTTGKSGYTTSRDLSGPRGSELALTQELMFVVCRFDCSGCQCD